MSSAASAHSSGNELAAGDSPFPCEGFGNETPRLLRASDRPFGLDIALDDEGGHSLTQFHDALRRAAAGEGQARIVAYGASHVASDAFTGWLRRELQARFGDGGPGFVIPVKPWRSYRRRGLEITGDARRWTSTWVRANTTAMDGFGLPGVITESDRAGATATLEIEPPADGAEIGSRVELYYLRQPNGGDFEVRLDGHRVERIATASATPEPGYSLQQVPPGAHRYELRVRGNGPVRLFGVSVDRERPGVVLDTLGINGARSRYQLLWEETLQREHLQHRDPDLVILAYGTNESGDDQPLEIYEADLRQVVGRVRSAVPDASCVLIGPSDRPLEVSEGIYEDRPRTTDIIAVQRRVAHELGCGFFDIVAFQGGPLSTVEWAAADPPYATPDHVHFTLLGYERLGEALFGALVETYGELPPPAIAGR